MFEIQLPAFKKIQTISAVAACVGFVIGVLIPARAIFANNWPCPFGNGPIQVCGFLGITGIGSGIVAGNLAALVLMGLAKYRRMLSNSSRKRK
jgi:hypothetical protein